jgi:TRAP-type mannitol/chloroaromatic compound transport system permease small subunit
MGALERFVAAIEWLNTAVGKLTAWLALGTVLVCFATVYLRYALNTNFTWLQEAYVWQHAIVILLGAAYSMLTGNFVRVDIFYGKMAPKRRAMVDLVGTLVFLFPFLAVVGWVFLRSFLSAYSSDEGSNNPGGLPNWWILQGALLVFTFLIFLQGLAMIARSFLVFGGREDMAGTASH